MIAKTIIKVEDLVYSYNKSSLRVLKEISLKINQGECIAVIGQNGAGKTTLAKHFNGLNKPGKGRVYINGIDTQNQKVSSLAKTVGYVFQNPDHQIFHDTVWKEVAFGLKNQNFSQGEIDDRVGKALESVDLMDFAQAYPFNLSKGQRQRVALASVLAMRPQVIVLDEPTTGQDYLESKRIMGLVKQLNEQGHTIIFITHDMSLVAEYAHRVIVMCQGEVIADDNVRTVFSQPDLLAKTYLRPPQITVLAQELRRHSIPSDILTVREMYDFLTKEKENVCCG